MTSEQRLVADGMVFSCLFGSMAHGTAVSRSDVDIRGVFILPRQDMLSPFNVASSVTLEGDTLFFEAVHFASMVASCNPNILEVLWAPDDMVLHADPAWRFFAARRDEMLSVAVGSTYGGFARGELMRLRKIQQSGVEGDPASDDAYRFRKHAAHVLRLLRMAHEALRGKGVLVRRTDDDEELVSIKNGTVPVSQVLQQADALFAALPAAKAASVLPIEVPRKVIARALSDMLDGFWSGHRRDVTGMLRPLLGLVAVDPSPIPSSDAFLGGRTVVIDVEGSGHSGKGVRDIVEVACLEMVDGMPTGQAFHVRLRPDREPTEYVRRLHGISWLDVMDCQKVDDVHAALMQFIGDSPLIAHGAHNDRRMLALDFSLAGKPLPTNKWFCTAQLGKHVMLSRDYHSRKAAFPSLDRLCDVMGVERGLRKERLHGAMLDCGLVVECLGKMVGIPSISWVGSELQPPRLRRYGEGRHDLVSDDGVLQLSGQPALVSADADGKQVSEVSGRMVPVPSYPHTTHALRLFKGALVVVNRRTGYKQNPVGPHVIFWKGDDMWAVSHASNGHPKREPWAYSAPDFPVPCT